MKNQKTLLAYCLHNEIPAIVFQGDDSCISKIFSVISILLLGCYF